MNIYRISQAVNNNYDTYDSAIVVAPDDKVAQRMSPGGDGEPMTRKEWAYRHNCWASSPSEVTVKYVGVADAQYDKPAVLLASFNAG